MTVVSGEGVANASAAVGGVAKASPKALLACRDGTLHPRATGSQYGVGRGSRRNEYNGNRTPQQYFLLILFFFSFFFFSIIITFLVVVFALYRVRIHYIFVLSFIVDSF